MAYAAVAVISVSALAAGTYLASTGHEVLGCFVLIGAMCYSVTSCDNKQDE